MRGLVLLVGTAAATRDSTVSKVISLLDDLKAKVQSDLTAEATLMEEFEAWCDTQKTETSYAIKDEIRIINEQSAQVEDSTGKMEEFSAKIAELGPKIAAHEQEKA